MISKLIILLALYLALASLISILSTLKNDNPGFKFFVMDFCRSFVALLLMPFILNSVGNESLTKFLSLGCEDFDLVIFMELIAYSCAIALAGNRVISSVLDKLNLSEMEEKLENRNREVEQKLKAEINELEVKQLLVEVDVDKAQGSSYKEILKDIADAGTKDIELNSENMEIIKKAELRRYIDVSGEYIEGNKIECKILPLGKKFLSGGIS